MSQCVAQSIAGYKCHTCTHMHTHAYTHVHTCTHMHTHMHTHTHAYIGLTSFEKLVKKLSGTGSLVAFEYSNRASLGEGQVMRASGDEGHQVRIR